MDPDQVNELSGNPNAPLAFRMMENLPGFTSSFLFAQHRGSNTVLRGGFMDDRRTFGGRRSATGKLGGFGKGSYTLTQPTEKAYYGRRGLSIRTRSASAMFGTGQDPVVTSVKARRATRLANAAGTSEGKMAFGKGARANHLTARPRALSRYSSLGMFNAAENTASYSPFQALAKYGGNQAKKSQAFRDAFYGGKEIGKEEQVFQRGMLSMITAGRKADILEGKAKFSAGGQAENRAARKVLKAQEQVKRLAIMNNPSIAVGSQVNAARSVTAAGGYNRVGMSGMTATQRLAQARTAATAPGLVTSVADDSILGRALAGNAGKVGLTGDLMIDAMKTPGAQGVGGAMRTLMGQGKYMTSAAGKEGGRLITTKMEQAIFKGIGSPSMHLAGDFFQKGAFKTFGVKGTMQIASKSATGAAMIGGRTAMMAIPGLNVLATAALVYDLGKMGGELVKSGVNLAKDAVKSMKGSIDKPIFGMGYKDNEVSATSRSRGVMAIQNSRLNARSMLGSEGSMMAAHFG